MRRPLVLALVVAALAPPALAAAPFAERLLAELNRARAGEGLGELTADPELAAVAQARVDSMAGDGWFALASPAGKSVENDLDARHYAFRLVTEKLVRSVRDAGELVAGWSAEREKNADSLFLPEVDRVGIGVAEDEGVHIVDIVLVESAAAGTAPGRASVGVDDREAAVAALAELVVQRRKAAGTGLLAGDPELAAAAQSHAERVLAGLLAGGGARAATPLPDAQSELVSLLVVDAETTGVALRTIEQSQETADFLDPSLTRLGIGLAVADGGDRRRVVWVLAMRRN